MCMRVFVEFFFLYYWWPSFWNTRIMSDIKCAESVTQHPSESAVKTNYCRSEWFKRHKLLSCSLQHTTFKRNLLIYSTIQEHNTTVHDDMLFAHKSIIAQLVKVLASFVLLPWLTIHLSLLFLLLNIVFHFQTVPLPIIPKEQF